MNLKNVALGLVAGFVIASCGQTLKPCPEGLAASVTELENQSKAVAAATAETKPVLKAAFDKAVLAHNAKEGFKVDACTVGDTKVEYKVADLMKALTDVAEGKKAEEKKTEDKKA